MEVSEEVHSPANCNSEGLEDLDSCQSGPHASSLEDLWGSGGECLGIEQTHVMNKQI